MSETRGEQRRGDRLQAVADAIRLMKTAPSGSDHNMQWDSRELSELKTERQVDGFNMAVWLAGPRTYEQEPHHGDCRTIGCIAGTTATLFRSEADETDKAPAGAAIEHVAATILGLDMETAETLFSAPTVRWASLSSITREQAARACEKTAAGCEPSDIWSHVKGRDGANKEQQ